jgi:hypothetical protein
MQVAWEKQDSVFRSSVALCQCMKDIRNLCKVCSLKAKCIYLRRSDKLSTTFNIHTHSATTDGKFPLVKLSLILVIRKTSAHLGQNSMLNAVINHALLNCWETVTNVTNVTKNYVQQFTQLQFDVNGDQYKREIQREKQEIQGTVKPLQELDPDTVDYRL